MFTDPTTKTKASDNAPVRKFMFDHSFDDAAVVHRVAERKPVLMKPEQIDELKKESFDSGFEAGKKDKLEEQTRQIGTVLTHIERNLVLLLGALDQWRQENDVQTRSLVLSVARKILPDFTARHGIQEIEAMLNETLRDMAREPRLVLRVHESQFDAINEKAQNIAAMRAYAGKVIVLADPNVALSDCRIEWADGGLERDSQATWKTIDSILTPSS